MRLSPFGAVAGLVLAPVLATSCGSGTDISGGALTPPATPGLPLLRAGCAHSGAGFALSFAIDSGGQPTPRQAAVDFGEHGGMPEYRAAADKWIALPSATDSFGQSVPGVTLRAGDVFLHVVQLNDGSWAVDSGGHCTA